MLLVARTTEVLHINQNEFVGGLPNLFEHLTGLVELYVGKNEFTGTLPSTISMLSNIGKTMDATAGIVLQF